MYIIFNQTTGHRYNPHSYQRRTDAQSVADSYSGDDVLVIRPIRPKYKVWMHLEEIAQDENGEDFGYHSLDEEILPLPLGEFSCMDNAIGFMEGLYQDHR